VRFSQSDWFLNLQGEKFDVIVSNPPYIAENDAHLTQGDLRFEPLTALASGKDGLDDIRLIIQAAPSYLNLHGWLMLEHGYDQAEKVAELLRLHGFEQISHAPDLSGTLRVTLGRMPQ
jgi:release factor glutamine methyltransferase